MTSVRLTDKTTITTSAGTMGPGTSAIADALTTLLQVKNREYVGFFRGEKIRGGVLRNLIGLPAKVKEKWTGGIGLNGLYQLHDRIAD